MGPRQLYGKEVLCRLLEEWHILPYLASFSPLIQSLLHVSDDEEKRYLQERLEQQKQCFRWFYTIFNSEDELTGAIEIRSPQEHKGQLYFWMNEQYWGMGYFQEALYLILSKYFSHMHAVYVNALVDQTNKRSYYALKKAGFADIGINNGPHGLQYELIVRKKS